MTERRNEEITDHGAPNERLDWGEGARDDAQSGAAPFETSPAEVTQPSAFLPSPEETTPHPDSQGASPRALSDGDTEPGVPNQLTTPLGQGSSPQSDEATDPDLLRGNENTRVDPVVIDRPPAFPGVPTRSPTPPPEDTDIRRLPSVFPEGGNGGRLPLQNVSLARAQPDLTPTAPGSPTPEPMPQPVASSPLSRPNATPIHGEKTPRQRTGSHRAFSTQPVSQVDEVTELVERKKSPPRNDPERARSATMGSAVSPTAGPTMGPASDPTMGPASDPTMGPTVDPTMIVRRDGLSPPDTTMVVYREAKGAKSQGRRREWLAALAVVLLSSLGIAGIGIRMGWWGLGPLTKLKGSQRVLETLNPTQGELAKLVAKARQAAKQKRWAEATVLANAALMVRPDHEEALELALLAADALENAPLDAATAADLEAGDWQTAVQRLEEVPAASRNPQWQELYAKAMAAGREASLGELQQSLARGELDDARMWLEQFSSMQADASDVAHWTAKLEAQSRGSLRERGERERKKSSSQNRKARLAEAQDAYREAQAFINSEDNHAARRKLEKVLKVQPNHALAHRAMGIVMVRLGEREKAAYHYQRFVELRPTAAEATQIREMLRRYEESK